MTTSMPPSAPPGRLGSLGAVALLAAVWCRLPPSRRLPQPPGVVYLNFSDGTETLTIAPRTTPPESLRHRRGRPLPRLQLAGRQHRGDHPGRADPPDRPPGARDVPSLQHAGHHHPPSRRALHDGDDRRPPARHRHPAGRRRPGLHGLRQPAGRTWSSPSRKCCAGANTAWWHHRPGGGPRLRAGAHRDRRIMYPMVVPEQELFPDEEGRCWATGCGQQHPELAPPAAGGGGRLAGRHQADGRWHPRRPQPAPAGAAGPGRRQRRGAAVRGAGAGRATKGASTMWCWPPGGTRGTLYRPPFAWSLAGLPPGRSP